jgi:probable F420-dependent oxidoreductase
MTQPPFRFGVFGEDARTPAVLLDTARRAEGAGYSTFLICDHFIDEPFGHQLAPLTALATVAAATTRLRVGSLVFSNDYRHPAMLAKEIATLDAMSNGRVELGLGAGFSKAEYDRAGLPFDPPGVRVDRLEESIHVLKGLLGERPFTFVGKHYAVTGLDGYPKPVQRPHPPLDRRRGQADALDRGPGSRHHRLSDHVDVPRRHDGRLERPPGTRRGPTSRARSPGRG